MGYQVDIANPCTYDMYQVAHKVRLDFLKCDRNVLHVMSNVACSATRWRTRTKILCAGDVFVPQKVLPLWSHFISILYTLMRDEKKNIYMTWGTQSLCTVHVPVRVQLRFQLTLAVAKRDSSAWLED